MTASITQLAIYLVVLLVLSVPVGWYIARVMEGKSAVNRIFGGIEHFLYRLCGIRADADMGWKQYALALLLFNIVGLFVVYALQRLQFWLPLNPAGMVNVSADSSFNTAVSFVTNTNWQGYVGESTMSYLTQMLALSVQNFVSAATGIAVAFALIRGFARHSSKSIGNFWVDMTRSSLYVLLPLSVLIAVVLMSQGVIQNFKSYVEVSTLETTAYTVPRLDAQGQPLKDEKGAPLVDDMKTSKQTLPMGPVASQEAIKMVGTNGGGFFNANSAHPYENPTPLSNFVQMLAILIIPAALCTSFGMLVGDRRQGWAILAAMTLLFIVMTLTVMYFEQQPNPALAVAHATQGSGMMEGKETRFGVIASSLFAAITTAASCGAVNAMHDSLSPLGGLVPMLQMQLGEVVYGGVGAGLYGMLIFAVLAVFIAGLMIGRTPEYLGKKIGVFDMKMMSIAILMTPALVLVLTAISVMVESGLAGIANPGAHGFSEILYAFSSAANNNGSAFAGLSANTPYYNVMTGIAMWLGRFGIIVPVLAMAGSLAGKKRLAATSGTLPTHGPLFVALLIGAVILVGALTYVPALALGPVIEHLQMMAIK
ncbi:MULTISPECIES: potassium-transporting ATPase subunit KdpA [unclassified Herbaspirillum]|uniref:potassium-transporting ATPase subunit KdpA n=1 Tax=unclassified Herbaspirillum TaxID=2624150 RepID=UPI000E2E5B29|nr:MULTISPECIES: potassium-transporting ATPase subunit KdpA [unclassified Herbaspirillum]RFB69667.1 potassium-transporting ATPase subunit KdpA [Herbaspirillum sp. 3R-3a1]TFI07268.1 potassium-transporting ATPase subunit KdpA [Herbaspirillum sp. 3R11]TFI12043.1 potassium-transporting ATPase subunit KdpA [Herbaspirillum sp. 3R-11]TFI26338.1 potassium-transporting ATPase subunit KdpA [Herbaspirillum sp. 3C11]